MLSLVLYFAPTLVAFLSQHKSRKTIGVLNLVLGWTGIGWVVCLVWSVVK